LDALTATDHWLGHVDFARIAKGINHHTAQEQ
jgi:hypothetical protein